MTSHVWMVRTNAAPVAKHGVAAEPTGLLRQASSAIDALRIGGVLPGGAAFYRTGGSVPFCEAGVVASAMEAVLRRDWLDDVRLTIHPRAHIVHGRTCYDEPWTLGLVGRDLLLGVGRHRAGAGSFEGGELLAYFGPADRGVHLSARGIVTIHEIERDEAGELEGLVVELNDLDARGEQAVIVFERPRSQC